MAGRNGSGADRQNSDERRAAILAAAERVFARRGLHGSTMADVAAEAGMSQGNLYRYFGSKDEIIIAFAEGDRIEIARDFAALTNSDQPIMTFEGFLRHHCIEEPRERAVLMLEIWAEATRNPTIAAACRAMEDDIRQRIASFIGLMPEALPLMADEAERARAADIMVMLVDGFFRRRATDPAFDHVAGTDDLLLALRAIMSGRVLGSAAHRAHEIGRFPSSASLAAAN